MTSIQNRTFEFQQCVSSFAKLNKKQAPSQQNGGNKTVPKSQFSIQAGIIAKDIAHTTDLLSKLALLAKRKPLFDDKPIEIGELTYVIKQDIFKIEENIKNLQRFVKGDHSIQVDSQITQYSKNVLNLLNSKMKNISGEFKTVLETRQKNELLNKNRTQQFLSATTHRSQSPQAAMGLGENPYAASMAASSYNPAMDGQLNNNNNNNPYEEYLSIPDQTSQLLLMEEQNGNQYLQERNRAVETIESTINEVGNLFQQLATMVSEQGEVIQRIDSNVEDINLNISGAQRELLKYYNHISSNRMLFLKIFGVLIVFFMLWVLVS
ncbi:integral membrane protein Sed5p [[Candida] anglica]|uniref:Integral membrane protein Sed5p n=1 Tax=[Candida] anglica TaxID=148631 RepID=A0ABP0E8M0_9ASCO